MSTGLRELRVWQEAVSLAGDVIRAVRPTIRRETKSRTMGNSVKGLRPPIAGDVHRIRDDDRALR